MIESAIPIRNGKFMRSDEPDREAKIAQFAKEYGFRLRFYRMGMCAIFDKWTPDGPL